MNLAPELAGELKEDRPQLVGDCQRIGCDGGGQLVNQVNKFGAGAEPSIPSMRVVATSTRRQKSLALIRAREVAANLSLPIVVLDPEGTIVFYNRAAEAMLGERFEAAGELLSADWARMFAPEEADGTPIPMREMPAGVALLERHPHHRTLHYTGIDGIRHEVAITAFPLMGREEVLFGAFAIFWHVDGGTAAG